MALTSGASSASALGREDDLGKIDGDDGQPGRLQQLLAEAHRLEGAGPGADRADPRVLQPAYDAADPDEPVEIGGEFVAVDVARVARRVGERHAVLIEVVGDRELAAEGVAAARDVDLVDFVVARLEQDRNAEPRLVDKLGNRDLVAEVRQADHETVDRIALLAKMRRVAPCVLARLHRAVLGRLDRQDAGGDVQPVELRDQLLARLERGRAVEKFPAADDQPEVDWTKIALVHGLTPRASRAARSAPSRAGLLAFDSFVPHHFGKVNWLRFTSHLEYQFDGCGSL